MNTRFANLCLFLCLTVSQMGSAEEANSVQQPFEIIGQPRETALLNDLFRRHYQPTATNCTLWDRWLPYATLWADEKARQHYRKVLLQRPLDAEGYVSMQQHRGMAHSEGWPFPAWQQSTGKGWHFSLAGEGWAIQNFRTQPEQNLAAWNRGGLTSAGIGDAGWKLEIESDAAFLETPEFRCGTIVAPFLRLEWSVQNLPADAQLKISWQMDEQSDWPVSQQLLLPLASTQGMQFANIPLYRQPGYGGLLKRYRLEILNGQGGQIVLKSLITAIDSRHPITNFNFIRGAYDYFCWTKDTEFLQQIMPRLRQSAQYALREFQVLEQRHVFVPWVGHDGRSGLLSDDGQRDFRPGLGVGNNYWDLLPFGGHDALATIYMYDACYCLLQLEQAIQEHPEWKVPGIEQPADISITTELMEQIQQEFQKRFWNEKTGRFVGWVDVQGRAYDYGFTFVNLEAMFYGLASSEQAVAIMNWLDGKRIVDGDTSAGSDIYYWRFGPRATTLRNTEVYAWVWRHPEAIPWGGQVQDGGAVLGFTYYYLMSRLRLQGPDAAWERLLQILDWYETVQQSGGYRAYYQDGQQGTLQGGGTAGGLGIDHEFFESILLPQIVLYGFLGLEPTPTGYTIQPKLPSNWQGLKIHGVLVADKKLKFTVGPDQSLLVQPSE